MKKPPSNAQGPRPQRGRERAFPGGKGGRPSHEPVGTGASGRGGFSPPGFGADVTSSASFSRRGGLISHPWHRADIKSRNEPAASPAARRRGLHRMRRPAGSGQEINRRQRPRARASQGGASSPRRSSVCFQTLQPQRMFNTRYLIWASQQTLER